MYKFKKIFFVPVLTAITIIAVSGNINTIDTFYKDSSQNKKNININSAVDTVPKRTAKITSDTLKKNTADTALLIDTLKKDTILPDSLKNDSLLKLKSDTFSIKISKDTFDAPVNYEASDSVVGLLQEKIIKLFGKAKAEYQDVSINAPTIELDQAKNILKAAPGRDTLGDLTEYAEMKQGQETYKTEGIEYNFKTQQGLTKGAITTQGEMYVHTEIAKKVDANTMYAKGTFFTTCNLDEPHFGFRARKSKIVNNKIAVTGSVRPEFDSVPIPIYLPFGYFPLYQGRRSGLLPPTFETNDQEGLGLAGIGYYKILGPHMDLQLRGDIYSMGSWKVYLNSKYLKNYKYSGGLNLSYARTQRNFRGDLDYNVMKNMAINWSHQSDMRSRPGTTFGANVNYSTTRNNQTYMSNYQERFQNTIGSSINYAKTWQDKPFNFTASATHNQNNSTHTININLPNLGFTMNTIYPFQKKESVGSKKWYEQLGIGYNGSLQNSTSFVDTLNYKSIYGKSTFQHIVDTMQWNASHNIPISLSLPPILGGAVTVSPSVSYGMDWVDRALTYGWDAARDTNYHEIKKGIHIKQRASAGLSFSTALFGTYQFKNKKVVAIRHVVRPNFSLNYTPDLNRAFWRTVQVDSSGRKVLYNTMDAYPNPYIARVTNQFVSRENAGMSFSFDNSLEMKVRDKKSDPKDTTKTENSETQFKKVRLIEGFGFNTSYNFMADSLKLAPLSIYVRTNLFEKVNISAGATLVPYQLNNFGAATSKYAWQGGKFSVGKITNANLSLSTSFQSKPKDPEKEKKRQDAINQTLNDPMMRADQQQLLEYMRTNPTEFVDFNTPWSVNLSFSFSYFRGGLDTTTNKWKQNFTASINAGGSFNLTPKWNFSVSNINYDFVTKKMQSVQFSISRDLHCWQLGINVGPIGPTRFFNFTISPKAGILQDLKINRTRSFYSGNMY